MGKNTKKPAYSSGSVSLNGRTVATATKNGEDVNTNYNMSEQEQKYYDALQTGMADSLTNLFNITDAQRDEWGSQLRALKSQGLSNINGIYDPIEKNLRNDIANRFGNLDNSVFLDKLNKVMDKKSQSIADLSNDLALAQNDLYNRELSNRMNTLSFLNDLNSVFHSNILGYTNAAASNSASGTSYNTATHNSGGNSWYSSFFPSSSDVSNVAKVASMALL